MEIYLAAFAGLLILKEVPTLHGRMDRGLNRLIGLMAFATLAWIAAVRVDSGTDYGTYEQIWAHTQDLSESSLADVFLQFLEPLFVVTNSLLKTFTDSNVAFFALYALLTIYPLHRAILHFGINQAHAYAVYLGAFYLPYAFNGMRQAIAMSLFLYALKYMLAGNTKRVWLVGLVAGGFHLTGLLIPLAYHASRICERRNWTPLQVMIVGLLGAAAISTLGLGGRLFFAAFEYKLETYTELFSDSVSVANMGLRIALAGLLVFAARSIGDAAPAAPLLFLYLLGLFSYLALAEFAVLATRFNMFFRVLEVILIPLLVTQLAGVKRTLVYLGTTALLLAALVAVAQDPDYHYQSIFSVAR